MDTIEKIREEIMQDEPEFTEKGWVPIFYAHPKAKIVLIGQAPGIKTQLKEDVFRDKSGDKLRMWMGVDEEVFYESNLISVLPLDFYFPGKAKTGDLPPRKEFAKKWHPRLLALMPEVELVVLIGSYAVKEYLKDDMKKNLTETVRHYDEYLPKYFPLVHPSPLNRRWEVKNLWFEERVVPEFRKTVQTIIK